MGQQNVFVGKDACCQVRWPGFDPWVLNGERTDSHNEWVNDFFYKQHIFLLLLSCFHFIFTKQVTHLFEHCPSLSSGGIPAHCSLRYSIFCGLPIASHVSSYPPHLTQPRDAGRGEYTVHGVATVPFLLWRPPSPCSLCLKCAFLADGLAGFLFSAIAR